jgi:hypothetical protein
MSTIRPGTTLDATCRHIFSGLTKVLDESSSEQTGRDGARWGEKRRGRDAARSNRGLGNQPREHLLTAIGRNMKGIECCALWPVTVRHETYDDISEHTIRRFHLVYVVEMLQFPIH